MVKVFSFGIFVSWTFLLLAVCCLICAAKEAFGIPGFYGSMVVLFVILALMAALCHQDLFIELESEQDYCWWRHLPP
jgi:hypothetical protein